MPSSLAHRYFLDDVPSARQTGARLHDILSALYADKALTPLQKDYLETAGYLALLNHAKGLTTQEEFCTAAREEQKARSRRKEREVGRQNEDHAEWLASSQRHNAKLFAAAENRAVRRRVFKDLDLGFIPPEDFPRVSRIAHGVSGGQAIPEADLLWFARDGADYATEALMTAHHRILAKAHSRAWAEKGDPWEAVNACANWRKGAEPDEGLIITGQALARTKDRRPRSAICTTRGGALRDLGRPREAKTMGLEAHGLNDRDYRPCTLLGACHIELGEYQAAAEWYDKAEARGASAKAIDADIRAILNAVAPSRRDEIRMALMALNPGRFGRIV